MEILAIITGIKLLMEFMGLGIPLYVLTKGYSGLRD